MNEFYTTLHRQLCALVQNSPHLTSNLANAAALLYHSLPDINWAGFYIAEGEQLLLGPFGGKPACLCIPFSRGVCGAAARSQTAVLVPDVHQFPGHIACDSASRSEIVLPLVQSGRLLGVLDIDSPSLARFTEEDAAGLSAIAETIAALPGWGGYQLL